MAESINNKVENMENALDENTLSNIELSLIIVQNKLNEYQ